MKEGQVVYDFLLKDLKAVLVWSNYGKPWKFQEDFEIDQTFSKVLERFNVSFDFGILKHIYYLVDAYCDAKRHGFKEVVDDYSIDEAQRDLEIIVCAIENEKVAEIENNHEFLNRLEKIFN